ncbi:MAG: DUF1559 domain-containing protein, partial [Planctomycetaceae bacterium]|nr:DUF1559 domain-containing protein [Planctomycetaceae bacterium]
MSSVREKRKNRLGFSVVELLITTAVIAILVGLMLPTIQRMREAGRRLSCQNNLKQIGIATAQFASAHRERLPPGRIQRENFKTISW